MLKLILLLTKSFLRDARMRRTMMFYGLLGALLLLFVGATWWDGWLRERPLLFLGYWAACAWLTLTTVLLAFFDMLLVRAALRAEKRRLAEEILKVPKDKPTDPPKSAQPDEEP